MEVTPLGSKIIVKELEPESVSAGGIFIPPTAQNNGHKPAKAEVMAVGPGKIKDGVRDECPVAVGDIVLIPAYQFLEFKRDGVEYKFIEFDQILGVVEEA